MSAHRPLLQTQRAAVTNRMEQGRLEGPDLTFVCR